MNICYFIFIYIISYVIVNNNNSFFFYHSTVTYFDYIFVHYSEDKKHKYINAIPIPDTNTISEKTF